MASNQPPIPRPDDEANPYAAPEAGVGPMVPAEISGLAEAIRREHINHEASIKGVGGLYYLSAVVFVLLGGTLIAGSVTDAAPDATGQALLVGLGVFYVAIGVLCGFIGYGLRSLAGWGRWLAVGLICVGFLFSIGGASSPRRQTRNRPGRRSEATCLA